jgi:tRNA(Glu) U13 pseudouridine synthase TruD
MQIKEQPEDFIVREHALHSFAPGPYKVYLLRKKNWNTEDCLQYLAHKLRVQRKDIGYAGNKDKRAVTEQYITIKNGPDAVYSPQDFSIVFLGSQQEPIRLGQHLRNFFTITVHDVKAIEHKPIVNYFGEQRFGGNNVEVGFALLRKDYKLAATLLGLSFTTDPISALRSIPKHTLLLYVHAVQSQLWNELAAQLQPKQDDVPMPGFAPEGNQAHLATLSTILAKLQDMQDFSASEIKNGTCIVSFSLGKGSYATETIKQLFNAEIASTQRQIEE